MSTAEFDTRIAERFEPVFSARALWRAALALAMLVAVTLVGIYFGRSVGAQIAEGGRTTDTRETVHFIGEDGLKLPANTVRFAEQRIDGPKAAIDMFLTWPDLQGYTPANRDVFNGIDRSVPLIFVTLSRRESDMAMAERYSRAYRPLLTRSDDAVAGDLVAYAAAEHSDYSGERFYVAETGDTLRRPFVAQCLSDLDERADLTTTPCQTDFHIGQDISVMYRFPESLLAEWRELDSAIWRYVDEALIVSELQRSMSRIAMEKLNERSPSSSSLKTTPRNSSPM